MILGTKQAREGHLYRTHFPWHNMCIGYGPDPRYRVNKTRWRAPMTREVHTNIGELISLFYKEFLELYGDEELASVAAATVITDLLSVEPVAPEAALTDAA